jgi:hypothetical protein
MVVNHFSTGVTRRHSNSDSANRNNLGSLYILRNNSVENGKDFNVVRSWKHNVTLRVHQSPLHTGNALTIVIAIHTTLFPICGQAK